MLANEGGSDVRVLRGQLLAATGIYNPQVMHHGHCIAEAGSFDALYCQAPAAPPHHKKYVGHENNAPD
jgi:hypothetical protein